jgi:hypothetical protein
MKIKLKPGHLEVKAVKVTEKRSVITKDGKDNPLYLPSDRVHVSSPIRFYKVINEHTAKKGEESYLNKYIMAYSGRIMEANTLFKQVKLLEKDAIIAEVEFEKGKYELVEID